MLEMSRRSKQLLAMLSAVVLFLFGVALSDQAEAPAVQPEVSETTQADEGITAIVESVIDGDTLRLENGERVRLIGINTPERGQPYYEEATAALRELAEGKTVRLERDVSEFDQYDRRLAYVYVGEVFVNEELVARGLAKAYPYEPDTSREDVFRRAELYAQDAGRGMWAMSAGSSDTAPGLAITFFQYDAPGDDTKNLTEEYFTLTNETDAVIHLTDYRVSDTANHEYVFPSFVLGAGKSVKVHTGTGSDSAADLYWNSHETIWNNDGDTLYLYDHKGELVLWWRY